MTSISSSMILSNAEKPTVINLMRKMTVDGGIVLEGINRAFPIITKLYRGRPEMLIMKMTNGRNMQMFRKGTVQILGCISDEEAENMRLEFIVKLRQLKRTMKMGQVSEMTISNIVMSAQLKRKVRLNKIPWSDCNVFHETELFPAALIRKWLPVHIALFQNGKVILTGLKSVSEVSNIMTDLHSFLDNSHYIS